MDLPYEMPFTTVYAVVDDWYQREGWRLVRGRAGVKPRFSDREVLTLEVVRELEGETRERRWRTTWPAIRPSGCTGRCACEPRSRDNAPPSTASTPSPARPGVWR